MSKHTDPPDSYYEPPEAKPVYCPVCMEEATRLYRGYWNDIIGCDNCVEEIDVDDFEVDDA